MYTPEKFKITDTEVLQQFIKAHPLGALVTTVNGEADATHIPFYLKTNSDGALRLQSHIARVNPLWKNCRDGSKVLLIFHGADSYISPNYYPSKKNTGKVVPTWNYSVVHVKGHIVFKHEADWILNLMEAISDQQEASQETPWQVADAPENYTQKMIKAVVGLEVEVSEITGQFKLSQNKSKEDYQGVLASLQASDKVDDQAVYEQMLLRTSSQKEGDLCN